MLLSRRGSVQSGLEGHLLIFETPADGNFTVGKHPFCMEVLSV